MIDRWAVIQLSPESEGVNVDVLSASLRRYFGGAEVRLVEGYALVRQVEGRARTGGEHRYIKRSMRRPDGTLFTMSDAEVRRLTRTRPVRRGGLARVLAGSFRGLTGRVEAMTAEQVSIRIELRSVQPLVTVARDQAEHAGE